MNGKERVLKTLSFEEVDRAPWVPYAGVQTANLIGLTAEEYLKSEDAIVEGVLKAYELYQPDGLPIVFDMQIEAEALGCELRWAKENPPAVVNHILEEDSGDIALEDLSLPTEADGRYSMALNAARRISEKIGDQVALYALICGPFTLASHLRGTDLFMDMIEEEEDVHKLMQFCTQVAKDFSGMYAKTGVDVIAVVDPMTSQISPGHFEEFVKPYLTELNRFVKDKGLKVTTFCCGNATKNLELMCQTDTDGIAFDENVDLAFAKEVATKNKVSFGGNIPLTTVMLFGSPLDNVNEAIKELEIGKGVGHVLSPGCDMPFDTPVDNIVAIGDYVSGNFTSLDMFASESSLQEEEGEPMEEVEIKPGEVFIEIVTLDSEGCAPCQYMCEAVKKVIPQFEEKITWRETLIKTKAGIKRTMELGVSNLPAMLINNEVVFDNIIPGEQQLKEAIQERINS